MKTWRDRQTDTKLDLKLFSDTRVYCILSQVGRKNFHQNIIHLTSIHPKSDTNTQPFPDYMGKV